MHSKQRLADAPRKFGNYLDGRLPNVSCKSNSSDSPFKRSQIEHTQIEPFSMLIFPMGKSTRDEILPQALSMNRLCE